MSDKTTITLDMACTCGDEAKQEYRDQRKQVINILWGDNPTPEGIEFAHRNYVTTLLFEMSHWGNGWMFEWDGAWADMWFAVKVRGENYKTKEVVIIKLQADTIEDALTDVFLYLHENYKRDLPDA